jgi:acetyltransferase-like isoleucine patch superfamily enzyme
MRLQLIARYLITHFYWRRRFKHIGKRSILFRPIMIANPAHITIGDRTLIRNHARIETIVRPDVDHVPRLTIGDNVNIEQGVHIICQSEVVIENDVSITPYCVIVDTDHPYNDPDLGPKIGARLNSLQSRVRIGRGSFIGAHAVILPGVDIGKGCVVAAGAVVTRSIPDYCVVAGSPARVIKRFDTVDRVWKVTADE